MLPCEFSEFLESGLILPLYFCPSYCAKVDRSKLNSQTHAHTNRLSNLVKSDDRNKSCDTGGTADAAPQPFRLGDPALCWSHPLVTHISVDWGTCCVFCISVHLLYFGVICVLFVFLQYFDTVGWVF